MDSTLGKTTKGSKGQSLVVRCGDSIELESPEGALGIANKELCLFAHLVVLRVEDRREHLDPLETLLEFGKGRQVDVSGQEQTVRADGDELATEVDGVADASSRGELPEVKGSDEGDGAFSDSRVHRPQRRQDGLEFPACVIRADHVSYDLELGVFHGVKKEEALRRQLCVCVCVL